MPDDLDNRLEKLDLRIREIDVSVKELGAKSGKWTNPLVLAILAGALGLLGNTVVALVNNYYTRQTERDHEQSALIFEAIKTGGNQDATCKNLLFFVNLSLIDDPDKSIQNLCPQNKAGIPSLPTTTSPDASNIFTSTQGYRWTVTVLDAHTKEPIENVKVTPEDKYLSACLTDAAGKCNFGFPTDHLAINSRATLEKDGYETVTTNLADGFVGPAQVFLQKSPHK